MPSPIPAVIYDALRELRHSRRIHQLQRRDDDPELLLQTELQLYQHQRIHAQIQQRLVNRQLRRRHPDDTRDMFDKELLGDGNSLVVREPGKVRAELFKITARALTCRAFQELSH